MCNEKWCWILARQNPQCTVLSASACVKQHPASKPSSHQLQASSLLILLHSLKNLQVFAPQKNRSEETYKHAWARAYKCTHVVCKMSTNTHTDAHRLSKLAMLCFLSKAEIKIFNVHLSADHRNLIEHNHQFRKQPLQTLLLVSNKYLWGVKWQYILL